MTSLVARVRAFVCIAFLAWSAPALRAEVEDFVGKPVVIVEVMSEGRPLDDASVLELVETRLGIPLSMRKVRESLTHLFSLGRFASVQVDASPMGNGVALRFDLIPLQVVNRLEFLGDRVLSRGDLRRAVVDAHGETFRADEAPHVAETLRRFYQDRGFLSAEVRSTAILTGRDRLLQIDIRAGVQARIERLIVRGISPTMYQLVLDRLGLRVGQLYDKTNIDRQLSDYEGELRRRGYYEASFGHEFEINPDGTSIRLLLDLQRGRRITVAFAGDTIPGTDPSVFVPIEREASVDEDLLEDADRRITAHLNTLGYKDATVTHMRSIDGDDLTVTFEVSSGRSYEISEVIFTGNTVVPSSTLEPLSGVVPGDPFVESTLQIGLSAVAEHYSRLGYATIRVEPLIAEKPTGDADGPVPVSCVVEIVEGTRTAIRSIVITGNEFLSDEELRLVIGSTDGGSYYAPQVVDDRDAIRLLYLNDGYEQVVVTVETRFDDDLKAVDLTYRISKGPRVIIEHILVVGNNAVESQTIRREIALREGGPLGLADVVESRRRLNALGLFRRVDFREFSHGAGNRRDVVLVVDEAPATRLAYGGGLELSQRLRRMTDKVGSQAVERIEFAPRGFFEIGRRSLGGKNRSIDLFTRISLRRQKNPTDPAAAAESSSFGFNEYRILGTYREPRTFGLPWDVLITGYVEQAIRSGFDLFSRGLNAQIRRGFGPATSANISYRLGQNDTSNKELNPADEPLVDRLFPEVLLSSFSGGVVRDTRDDPFDPTRGSLFGADTELAARSIGSEVGFAKTFMQGFIYRAMPGTRVVFAGGARIGLAFGFPRTLLLAQPPGPDSDSGIPVEFEVEDSSLPISERFFAGGDTTVRGFALDQLGDNSTIDQDGFPRGGNAMVIFNGEFRVPVTRDLGLVGFLDVGNVYDVVSNLRLGRIRGGTGFGVRYRSPVGPIRVDLGFKLDRRELGNGELERLTALHISIGQAF